MRRPPPAGGDHDPAPTRRRAEPPDEDRDAEETVAALAVPAEAAGSSGTRAEGRKHRRNRRRAVAAGVAIVAVLALVGGLVLTSGGTGSAHAARIRLKVPHTVVATASDTALIATTKVLLLTAYAQPSTTSKAVSTFSNKTSYGLARTFLITGQKPGWDEVLLPMRPNDTSGWIQQADVTQSQTSYKITVDLTAHHLWFTNAGKPVLDTPVVIGNATTPTPTGLFYVTDPVNLQSNPNTAYGVYALGLSAYSNVLTSFDGGPGQVAVHGTDDAAQVGQSISNGCVRIPNPDILQIAAVVPLGTPVVINA